MGRPWEGGGHGRGSPNMPLFGNKTHNLFSLFLLRRIATCWVDFFIRRISASGIMVESKIAVETWWNHDGITNCSGIMVESWWNHGGIMALSHT